ncbi:ATP-binding protein [Sphingomonas aerophila]|uniref:Signal transduction histidine kinase n=1 Tax=Sphingomonas aerophila TaxID=1344948 RepID=A0A7W9EX94_9SPHN|nr:ATP-binding protein [Sphingomonas aerophila]MBB5716303.1 signal transduction histidine kinase [Sphingomonas aerophila]
MASFTPALPREGERARPVLAWVPMRGDWILLALYAVGFWLAHGVAAPWGGTGYYSLWFPAAGVRLALLWRGGARLTIAAALVELLVDTIDGAVDPFGADRVLAIIGVVRPVVAYGLTVAAIRWLASGARAELLTAPMPFGLAAVLAPNMAALAALPQALLRPELTGVAGAHDVLLSLSDFAVGDLLGTLIVAPPLLWIADRLASREIPNFALRKAALAEAVGVLLASLLIAGTFTAAGLGLQPMPVLLATVWIGLRFGRAPAWMALVLVVALVLPQTAGATAAAARLQIHLALATVVVAGYLAGSFADAQAHARADLSRRDRLLFQAERLKTLRAMSVAVIHEVSQPLSTLAIEARHLHELSVGADPEIAAGAALIDRKAHALSDLVRRLRRFGGSAADQPSALPVSALLDTVSGLAQAEAKAARVRLEIDPGDPDLLVFAQEVELAQAAVNLVRNAVHACDDGVVRVDALKREEQVVISVHNRCAVRPRGAAGMGVGLLVARAIVEAHGGRIERQDADGLITHSILLPLAGEP